MNSRKYRVICRLNALDRRLRELRNEGASWPAFLQILCAEAGSIATMTAPGDRRYVSDRLDYMLQAHCTDDNAVEARCRLAEVVTKNNDGGNARAPGAFAESA